MGYTTDFNGSFKLTKPLTEEQAAYITKFCQTRRMKRDASKTALRPDPVREAVGLPVGTEGEFFVGEGGDFGQGTGWGADRDQTMPDLLEYNISPSTQPGLWCQWVPTTDRDEIVWDGGEKFYNYIEWMDYIIDNFLTPWGIEIDPSSEVRFQGEEDGDRGKLVVLNGRCRSNPSSLVELARCGIDVKEEELDDE